MIDLLPNKDESLDAQHLLLSAISKKESEKWKVQSGSTQWNV